MKNWFAGVLTVSGNKCKIKYVVLDRNKNVHVASNGIINHDIYYSTLTHGTQNYVKLLQTARA